jgi:hypothetical protein
MLGYADCVMPKDGPADTSLLDEWVASVGEEAVVAAVEEARRRIAVGSTPGFTDKEQFLEYLGRPRHRSA